jgi:hypothetical protein
MIIPLSAQTWRFCNDSDSSALRREQDGFSLHSLCRPKSYSYASAHDGKGGKKVERAAHASYVQTQDYGFKGSVGDWEALLRLRTQLEKRPGF